MAKKNDMQKSRIRKVEAEVFAGREPNLLTEEDCQEYVTVIMTSKWFLKLKASFTSVIFKSGSRRSHIECHFERVGSLGTMAVISAPVKTRIDWMILHTLCHLLSWKGEPHDRNWCRLYLAAVKQWLPADYKALRAAYTRYGVHWYKPRSKRVVDSMVMRTRMVRLREAKRLKQQDRDDRHVYPVRAAVSSAIKKLF
jgi:hypothetical protein